jgi:hypothetical protein
MLGFIHKIIFTVGLRSPTLGFVRLSGEPQIVLGQGNGYLSTCLAEFGKVLKLPLYITDLEI